MGRAGGSGVDAMVRGPRFHGVDTGCVRPRERFDYWRSLFPGAAMAPMGPDAEADYRAATFGCFGDDGFRFDDMRVAGTAAHYAGGHDMVRLSVVHRGEIAVTHGGDRRDLVRPGSGLHLFDTSRVADVDSATGYHAHYLTIPMAAARRATGGDPVAGGAALRRLPETPLSIMLKTQLALLARHGAELDGAGTAAAMRALSGLATACLASLAPSWPEEESPVDEALFAAALTLIDRHVANPRLTAAWVARALNCSRTRLYRVFQRRGVAVTAYIRDRRLQQSRALLRDPRLDIGEIAYRCGYADASAFGKAFRRQFGMAPRDWRLAAA